MVLLTYDSQRDLFVAYVDKGPLDSHVAAPGTWTFDARTATWSRLVSTTTPGIECGWGFAPECGAVFDARTGVSVFLAMGGTQIMGYDAEKRAWQALYQVDGSVPGGTDACDNDTPVHDSVNQRIVCRAAWSGVTAIDSGTGMAARPWWLLEPLPETSPAP